MLAGGLAVGLLIAVVLVLALRGSEAERKFAAAPPKCIETWNGDPAAISFGKHQSGAHGYFEVQVLTLTPDRKAEAALGDPGSSCTVVFAAAVAT